MCEKATALKREAGYGREQQNHYPDRRHKPGHFSTMELFGRVGRLQISPFGLSDHGGEVRYREQRLGVTQT